jgi:hypothetical protein
MEKWFQYFFLKVSIIGELNWKLPKLKVAKVGNCRNLSAKMESDLSVSC